MSHMEVTVHYNKLAIAPRKIRAILHRVRDRRVVDALAELAVTPRTTSEPIRKLLLSSISAVRDRRADARPEDLTVKAIFCNEAARISRTRLRGRGRSSRIAKSGSHLTLTVLDAGKTTRSAAKKPAPTKQKEA
ncbi:MAG: uL22 family ribosomal protein [Patescibacteria group bacterium]